MTSLADQLRERIKAEGPITVEAYMAACNAYYYATRDPLGEAGDFTTAPEISQMFGELVGACLADCWRRAGAPPEAVYAELGPGRGTLAADALRVLRKAGFSGGIHLVETSAVLRQAQRARLEDAHWHERIEELPPAPLLLAANEFLDALPIRQWIGGEERVVRLASEKFEFATRARTSPPPNPPRSRGREIWEDSPTRAEAAKAIATHLANHGGVALVIDYGHAKSAPGDTLQAVKAHRFADPLADPGEQDLTAHVDFEALALAVEGTSIVISGPATQGEWLKRLGIDQRAQSLIASNRDKRHDVEGAIDRLCGLDEMGELFKVMAMRGPRWPAPVGFAP